MASRSLLRSIRQVGSLTLILFLLLLAACSTTTSGDTSASQTPVLAPQQCGAVHAFRSVLSTMDQTMAKKVEDCFWQAFVPCRPATLSYTQSDSEVSTIHTFSLTSENSTCRVADRIQHFPTLHQQSFTTYACAGVQKQADGLHILSCGPLGTILIPAARDRKSVV